MGGYNDLKLKIKKLREAGFYKFKGSGAFFLQKSEGDHHTRFTLLSEELADISPEEMDFYIREVSERLEEELKDYIKKRGADPFALFVVEMRDLIIATCKVCKFSEKEVNSLEEKRDYICVGCKHKSKQKQTVKK